MKAVMLAAGVGCALGSETRPSSGHRIIKNWKSWPWRSAQTIESRKPRRGSVIKTKGVVKL